MLDLKVKISTPAIDRLAIQLSPSGRRTLNEAAVKGLYVRVRDWLRRYALAHHDTAHRLGARPTGILEQAASTMTWRTSDVGGSVSIAAPGIRRALGPLTITPRAGKRALTIPMAAIAYGRKVYEVRRNGHELFRPRGKDYLAEKDGSGNIKVVYLLRSSVRIKQDRSILPSDEEMGRAATNGVHMLLRRVAKK